MYLKESEVLKNIEASNKNSFKVKALVYSNFRLLQKLRALGHSWVRIAEGIQPCVDWDVKPDSIRAAFQSAVEYFSNPENHVLPEITNEPVKDVHPVKDAPRQDRPVVPAPVEDHVSVTSIQEKPTQPVQKPASPNKVKLIERAQYVREAGKPETGVRIDEPDDVEASIIQARRALKPATNTNQNSSDSSGEQWANTASESKRPKISTSLM